MFRDIYKRDIKIIQFNIVRLEIDNFKLGLISKIVI